jgi:hypothetical protein
MVGCTITFWSIDRRNVQIDASYALLIGMLNFLQLSCVSFIIVLINLLN